MYVPAPAHLSHVCTCPCTPALSVHLPHLRTCPICTPALSAHLPHLRTCPVCTPAPSVHLSHLCTCPVYAPAPSEHLPHLGRPSLRHLSFSLPQTAAEPVTPTLPRKFPSSAPHPPVPMGSLSHRPPLWLLSGSCHNNQVPGSGSALPGHRDEATRTGHTRRTPLSHGTWIRFSRL